MDRNSNDIGAKDDLIVKYLNRQSNQHEIAELQSWISESEENQRYFIETQYLWNHTGVKNKPDIDTAFQNFKNRLQEERPVKLRSRLARLYPVLRYAAILLIAFVLGGMSYYFINGYQVNKNDSKQYSIYVPYGAKTRVELPDKSVVWLNAGSTLSYKQSFDKKARNVYLKGEGYFEVKHNASRPFIVHANQASIEDLGTEFDVKAYPEDTDLNVTLLKGSIQLTTIYKPGKPLLLKPNQSAIINKLQKNVVVKPVVADNAAAWTQGKILFNDVLFGNIVRRLERDYNVKIVVKNPKLNKLRFIGDFQNAQSIGEILDIMTANNDFHYKRNKNVITVYR